MSVLSLDRVAEIVAEEARCAGGDIRDRVEDERRLYLRTGLRHRESVTEGDVVEAGVAVRMVDQMVHVHPYAYRLICANGSVLPAVSEADTIELTLLPMDVQEERLRESVRDCSRVEHFAGFMEGVRSMRDPMTMVLMMRQMMDIDPELMLEAISAREDQDLSAYTIWNAITAHARRQSDPERRWQIEKIGGGIPARLLRGQEDREWSEALKLPTERRGLVPA